MIANLGMGDRIIRLLAGSGLIVATMAGWIGLWGWIGTLPLLTGIYGVCPAYMPFRFNTFGMRTTEKE